MEIGNYDELIDLGYIRNSSEFSEVYKYMGRMRRRGLTLRVLAFALPCVAVWFATQLDWYYDSAWIGVMIGLIVALLTWFVYSGSTIAYHAEAAAVNMLRDYSDRFAAARLEERLNTTRK
ncbi:hypothetical protein [Vibrio harveyi]|uniref:hypothetical protein n=1 Tax=Vibrio harveyi TaxID=669 RepID=UPI003CEE478B